MNMSINIGTGSHREVGSKKGRGFNLNITWEKGGVGDTEYAAAFIELVLPLITSYEPDLILVSCGFDAAKDDLLGDCNLTTPFYFDMTKSVLQAAGTDVPIVMILEGGYNLDVISDSMEAVALALLDEPYPYHLKKVNAETSPSESFQHDANTIWSHMCSSLQDSPWMVKSPLSISQQLQELKQRSDPSKDSVKVLIESMVNREKKLAGLKKAQMILSPYWNQRNIPSNAKIFALKSINNSMMALFRTKVWKYCQDIALVLIPIPKIPTLGTGYYLPPFDDYSRGNESTSSWLKRDNTDALNFPSKKMKRLTLLEQDCTAP